ncbi:hypothetical protein [Sphingobacterium bambusae]|uniref:Lipoprotein n=1 Tax=Sphingobacterium bambusae TaxID=662858 RepID=A0ABW6BK91_9SPHI|nr:hypothetical protein [Sphingobacterium bambusae]WPL47878.1 hypothetical protein SCB77_18170 [Sphingobacterium bambusae]
MKQLLFISLIALFSTLSCAKSDSMEEDVYSYEVSCEHCDISYLDDTRFTMSVKGHRGSWKKEFKNAFFLELEITVRSLNATSSNMTVHILKNGKQVASQSGNQVATAYHVVHDSGSTKPSSTVCGAPTQKGGACQRKVSGGGRCWQHK